MFRHISNHIAFAAIMLALASCTTLTTSNPPRTATEQLLISTAADRAAAQLALPVKKGSLAFVDASNFEGTDSKYAIGAIRENLLRRGATLVDDKKLAEIIIEIRSGALSTDQKQVLVGIPQFNLPVPFASSPIAFPEIALYATADQKGVAKFAMFGYNPKTGEMLAPQDPQYGFSHNIKKTLLIFFSWTDNDSLPEDGSDPITRGYNEIIPQKTGPQPVASKPSVEVMPQPEAPQSSSKPAPPLTIIK